MQRATPPSWTPDENQAPFVSSDAARKSYHCPDTACDGHHYVRPGELPKGVTCSKCGLSVTIGASNVGQNAIAFTGLLILALIVGLVIGLLVGAARL